MPSVRKLWKALGSRRLAICLLLSLVVLLLIGSFLPDPSLLSVKELALLKEKNPFLIHAADTLRVHTLTGSPFFLILPAFLFLSILSITSTRIISYVRLSPHPPLSPKGRGILGNPRFWGSITFHTGLLVILLGVSLSMLLGFSGGVLLTEGHTLSLRDSAGFSTIERKPISVTSLPALDLSLREFLAVYQQDRFPVDFKARLGIEDQDLNYSTETLEVNRPVTASGYRFTLQRYGFAPHFVITKGDRLLFDGDINLVVFTEHQEDTFDIPGTDYKVRARFFPDYYMEDGSHHSRSVVPKNPVFLLSIVDDGRPPAEGLLPLGKELLHGPLRISFVDLRHWAYLGMSRDAGLPIIIMGFILGIAGLAMRFYLPLIFQVRHDKH